MENAEMDFIVKQINVNKVLKKNVKIMMQVRGLAQNVL